MHLILIGIDGFFESWRLLDDGAWVLATVNLAGSIVLGLVALMAGIALGRWL